MEEKMSLIHIKIHEKAHYIFNYNMASRLEPLINQRKLIAQNICDNLEIDNSLHVEQMQNIEGEIKKLLLLD